MTASEPDTALQPARHRLADAISALIDPRRRQLDTGRHTWLDSIYQELADAVYEKHALGGGHAQPASPMWIAASDTLRDIDHAVRVEHPDNPAFVAENRSQRRLGHPTVLRLQAIDARTWRPIPEDVQHIKEFTADLERLTVTAENLLSGIRPWYLPNPCPRCKQNRIYVNDSGDQVRRYALEITPEYCRCQNRACDGYWPKEQFEFLGQLLGNPPPEGVIG